MPHRSITRVSIQTLSYPVVAFLLLSAAVSIMIHYSALQSSFETQSKCQNETSLGLRMREHVVVFHENNQQLLSTETTNSLAWKLALDHGQVPHNPTVEPSSKKSRRRFVKYTSSKWESMWLENISQWERDRSICENILSQEQARYLQKFQTTLCTHHLQGLPWCAVDDLYTPTRYFYNKETGYFATSIPNVTWEFLAFVSAQPVVPTEVEEGDGTPEVFSRLDFIDETTGEAYSDYIEPLVAHLRHPLAGCGRTPMVEQALLRELTFSRSFLLPPHPGHVHVFPRAYYFDAGASSWDAGSGGPSLAYFAAVWKRHGIDFDHIEGWEGTVDPKTFYSTVPDIYKNRTMYHKQWISSTPKRSPFVPFVIRNTTKKEDYALFKLDIDSGEVEKGTVDYLLSGVDDSLEYIDEFVWEHHAGGNYLMKRPWGKTADQLTIFESYQYFLQLRNKGVRAHSWV